MNVLKFGGTSMGDEHTWRRVLEIISFYDSAVIIVSATARTTRQLVAAGEAAQKNIEQAFEISRSIKKRHRHLVHSFLETTDHPEAAAIKKCCFNRIDQCIATLNTQLQNIAESDSLSLKCSDAIASIGEQLSAYLFAECGKAYGLKTHWIDARTIIKTDSDFGKATPDPEKIAGQTGKILNAIDNSFIPIIGGFYGENGDGEITTLGFEGSDYTASLLGAALQAQSIEIWTDVSGIYTCDPNMVKNARPIPELSFQEATELAYFGAKVLHPSTMKPAAAAQIPVFVKNIFEADHPGTKIHHSKNGDGWAKAITHLNNITILTTTSNGAQPGHQFLSQVFGLLHEHHVSVNAVTTTEASVSVALQHKTEKDVLQRYLADIGTVSEKTNQGLISLIGCNMATVEAMTQRIFAAIPETTPSLISYSKTKQNLNIAVGGTELIPAVCKIHEAVFESD